MGVEVSSEGMSVEVSSEGMGVEVSSEGMGVEVSSEGMGVEVSSEGMGVEVSSEGMGVTGRISYSFARPAATSPSCSAHVVPPASHLIQSPDVRPPPSIHCSHHYIHTDKPTKCSIHEFDTL